MMNQMDNERFVEAICWFLYNVTFDGKFNRSNLGKLMIL